MLLVAVLGRLTPAPAPKLLPLCSGVGGNPPGSSGGSCRHLGKGWPRCTQAPGGSRCQDAAISRLTSKSSWGLAREGSHTAHPARFRGRVLQGEHCYIKPRIQLEKQEAARRARLPPRRLLQRCASTPCPLPLLQNGADSRPFGQSPGRQVLGFSRALSKGWVFGEVFGEG